jgi:hypothetical protein
MKYRLLRYAAAMMLALANVVGSIGSVAMGQAQNPAQARDANAGRSTPPDTTSYVRPAIPEDRAATPFQRPSDKRPTVPGLPKMDDAKKGP